MDDRTYIGLKARSRERVDIRIGTERRRRWSRRRRPGHCRRSNARRLIGKLRRCRNHRMPRSRSRRRTSRWTVSMASPMPRPYARCLAHWWTADRTTIGNARPNGLWRDWYAAWIRRARRPGRDRVEARSLFMCRLMFCGGGGRRPCADWPRTVASRPGRCLRASRTIVSMDQDCARVRRSGPEWPDRWLR